MSGWASTRAGHLRRSAGGAGRPALTPRRVRSRLALAHGPGRTGRAPRGRSRPRARRRTARRSAPAPPRRWPGWPRRSPRPPATVRRADRGRGRRSRRRSGSGRARRRPAGAIRLSNAARQACAVGLGRDDRVDDVADAALLGRAGAGIERPLVHRGEEQARIGSRTPPGCRCRGGRRNRPRRPARSPRPGRRGRRWRRWRRGRSPSTAPARRDGPAGGPRRRRARPRRRRPRAPPRRPRPPPGAPARGCPATCRCRDRADEALGGRPGDDVIDVALRVHAQQVGGRDRSAPRAGRGPDRWRRPARPSPRAAARAVRRGGGPARGRACRGG